MPVYPGDPPVAFFPAATQEVEGYCVSEVRFGTHAGTHLDAPAHFLAGGGDVTSLPLARLIGPARVVDLKDVRRETTFEGGERLLIRTGWSTRWGADGYFDAFPPLPEWLIAALEEAPAGLLGLETPSLHPDHAADREFHLRLLAAGVVIVENLVGVEALPERFELAVLPLPLVGLDGSPCRAIAWGEQDSEPHGGEGGDAGAPRTQTAVQSSG